MSENRFDTVRELVKDPSLRVTEIAWKTGYNKGHVSRLRKEAMRQALETEQEPVAWISEGGDVSRSKRYMDEMGFKCNPLYAAPPKKQWVGLTADEIWKCNKAKSGSAVEFHICSGHQNVLDFAEAIEAKLREKNQ